MTTYKTTTGLTKACEDMISTLSADGITDQRTYDAIKPRVDSLMRQCKALWSNPADVEDFAKLANRLRDAWDNALG